jgi:hypothetical protein
MNDRDHLTPGWACEERQRPASLGVAGGQGVDDGRRSTGRTAGRSRSNRARFETLYR